MYVYICIVEILSMAMRPLQHSHHALFERFARLSGHSSVQIPLKYIICIVKLSRANRHTLILIISLNTVKIRDSALGLSGFVSFSLVGVSAGRRLQGEFIVMFYGPILVSLL